MKNTFTIEEELELEQIRKLFENSLAGEMVSSEFGTGQADPNLKTLIQPKSVTFSLIPKGQSTIDVLTETIRCLQPYMSKDPGSCISGRTVNRFFVSVNFEDVTGFHRGRKDIEKVIKNLEQLRFDFSWVQRNRVNDAAKKVSERRFTYSGILFIGHQWEENGYNYQLHINPMALPYLTFIGRGVGYTKFSYSDFIRLDNGYSKKFYQLLCDWASQGSEHSVLVDDLRALLSIPPSVNITQLKVRYVDTVRDTLLEANSSLRFDYDMKCSDRQEAGKRRGRKSLDTFVFHFQPSEDKVTYAASNKANSLKLCFRAIADREKTDAIDPLVEDIVRNDKLDFMFDKIQYYFHKKNKGLINDNEMRNTLLKIIRESFNVDLRSNDHIRNAAVSQIKKRK